LKKGKERRRNEMPDLYKEFMDWYEYNFPGIELAPWQKEVLRNILKEGIPKTPKELAQRLKDLLPKSRK